MSMSRREFEELASAIRSANERAKSTVTRNVVNQLAYDIASICASANKNFDRNRFFSACGVER